MKRPQIPSDEKERLAALDSVRMVCSPAEERFDRITRLAQTIFNVPIALVSLVSERCQWFKSVQGLTASQTPREISFCGHAILSHEALVVEDTWLNPDFADNPLVTGEPHIRFYAGHPLRYDGRNLGTLCIIDRVPRQFSPKDVETLSSLAAWVENELRLSALTEAQAQLLSELNEAKREALIDPLTKVWNRKGMEVLLSREFSSAKRKQQQVVLMLLDVDYYKDINDKYGHVAGDIALKEVAQRIRSSLRHYDFVARYGGDEFLVFATDCSSDRGILLANRILSRVRSEPIIEDQLNLSLSLSIGQISATATENLQVSQLIKLADIALYEAKDMGRDRIRHKRVKTRRLGDKETG
ncbi:MAG: sensor domain-containing diguanylate cyclase [Spirulinaceae cyanobacterium]